MPQDSQPFSPNLPDISPWLVSIGNWFVKLYPVLVLDLKHLIGFLVGISFPLSLFFLIGIVYCVEGLKKIRNKEELVYDLKVEPAFEKNDPNEVAMAHRWQKALGLIESQSTNDWKQAILEADIMLDDLLTKMGYSGESIGDKLKRVQPGDMKSLNEAWEAHKVRNQIAHEGSNFSLNQHEAKQVMHMYRKVFEEFYYV